MPIDQASEKLLSLSDAVMAVPSIDGRRPHVSTLWRWCRKGVRGVQLDYVRLGHRVCTSAEALARFAQRLAEADSVPTTHEPPTNETRSAREQRRSVARAEADLDAAGI